MDLIESELFVKKIETLERVQSTARKKIPVEITFRGEITERHFEHIVTWLSRRDCVEIDLSNGRLIRAEIKK